MTAMKKSALLLIVLVAMTAPASAAFLDGNSRLGESFLNTGCLHVGGELSSELPPGCGGAWQRSVAEFFVAPTTESLLQGHVDAAVERFGAEGLTPKQLAAVAKNPNLEPAFTGERIHTFFGESVGADPALQHLELTPRFQFGPDVIDPLTGRWYDVTTPGQWPAHVLKYEEQKGSGVFCGKIGKHKDSRPLFSSAILVGHYLVAIGLRIPEL